MKAFSLIELLVVIAIISILAALAAPVYLRYSIRAQVEKAYNVMSMLTQSAVATYEKTGSFPPLINYNANGTSYTIRSGTWVSINDLANYVSYLAYYESGNEAQVGVALPSSVTNPINGGSGSIFMYVTDNQGVIVYTCGYNGTMPLSSGVLPPNCTVP